MPRRAACQAPGRARPAGRRLSARLRSFLQAVCAPGQPLATPHSVTVTKMGSVQSEAVPSSSIARATISRTPGIENVPVAV